MGPRLYRERIRAKKRLKDRFNKEMRGDQPSLCSRTDEVAVSRDKNWKELKIGLQRKLHILHTFTVR